MTTISRFSRPLIVALALGAAACTGHTGPAGDEPDAGSAPLPDGSAPPAASGCAADGTGTDIVACGFGPSVGIVGASGRAVYALSAAGTYFCVDLDPGTTRLFHVGAPSSALTTGLLGPVLADDRIYFSTLVDQGRFASYGVVSIATTAPTSGDPRIVTLGDQTEPTGTVIADATRLYMESTVFEPEGGAYVGPVVATGLGGSALTPITPDSGRPVAVVDDLLYYRHDAELARVGLDGSGRTVLAAAVAENAANDRAVDASGAYTTLASGPYAITRISPTGATTLVVEASRGDVEITVGPPHDLRLADGALYYLQDLGTDYAQLVRVRLTSAGPGVPETLFGGPGLAPPVFADGVMYLAYTRGGYDAPIEGVIARFPAGPAS